MKIFVTVGTTKFDKLIEGIYKYALRHDEHEFCFQLAGGEFNPAGFEFFKFTDEIESYYQWADLIVSHAGAGTTYQLLELEKKLILVPNFERVNKHQIDIAEFMFTNRYALMARGIDELHNVIDESMSFSPIKFTKNNFFAHYEIAGIINGSSKKKLEKEPLSY